MVEIKSLFQLQGRVHPASTDSLASLAVSEVNKQRLSKKVEQTPSYVIMVAMVAVVCKSRFRNVIKTVL
jgi:hypothetical protein